MIYPRIKNMVLGILRYRKYLIVINKLLNLQQVRFARHHIRTNLNFFNIQWKLYLFKQRERYKNRELTTLYPVNFLWWI